MPTNLMSPDIRPCKYTPRRTHVCCVCTDVCNCTCKKKVSLSSPNDAVEMYRSLAWRVMLFRPNTWRFTDLGIFSGFLVSIFFSLFIIAVVVVVYHLFGLFTFLSFFIEPNGEILLLCSIVSWFVRSAFAQI